MPRNVVAPTETRDGDDVTLTHPAFAQIEVYKLSGEQVLYGSNIKHPNSIAVRISASQLERRYSTDRYRGIKRHFVEVRFSMAQWAQMVSSIGDGEGTPCTLISKDGQTMPEIPHVDRAKEFNREGKEAIDGVVEELRDLRAAIAENTAGVTKAKQAALLSRVDQAIRSVNDKLPFVEASFTEHLEEERSRAAIEINAMAQRAFGTHGYEAVTGGVPVAALQAPAGDDDER